MSLSQPIRPEDKPESIDELPSHNDASVVFPDDQRYTWQIMGTENKESLLRLGQGVLLFRIVHEDPKSPSNGALFHLPIGELQRITQLSPYSFSLGFISGKQAVITYPNADIVKKFLENRAQKPSISLPLPISTNPYASPVSESIGDNQEGTLKKLRGWLGF